MPAPQKSLRASWHQPPRPFLFLLLLWLTAIGGGQAGAEAPPNLVGKAEAGDLAAQLLLGAAYETGKGMAVDYQKAAFWYQKAAEAGHADGQRALGVLHEKGLGVAKDAGRAAEWYRRAAEQGLARAQVNLGQLYEEGGMGLARDYAQALHWYQMASAREYGRGENQLGLMYERGLGVEKNLDLARSLYQKAVAHGYRKAAEPLQRLEKRVGGKDKPESGRSVSEGKPAATPSAPPQGPLPAAELGPAERHFQRGNQYAEEKQFDQAIAAYNQALALEPDNINTLDNLAKCQAQSGRLREALAPLQRVVELRSKDPRKREELAAVLIAIQEYEAAMVQIKIGLALNPTQAGLYQQLAIALGQAHDFAKALKSARIAGALGQEVQELLAHLRQKAPAEAAGTRPEEREGFYLRQLVVESRAEAESCRAELEYGQEFTQLVAAKAGPAFRQHGGYFAYFRPGELGRELTPELGQVLEALPPFAYSPVLATKDGFRIFQKVVVPREILPPPEAREK